MPKIKKVITKEEGSRPVLVDFQNGKIKPGEGDNLESNLYKSTDGKIIVGVTNGNMLYTGTIENESDLYNNFLLVNNKTTGKVRLIQVDCCTVSPCLQKKSMDVSMATPTGSVTELNKQFGSKKTKRQTEQKERLKMNIDMVKEQLEKTVADIKIDENDPVHSTANENDSLYIPKINRNASTIDQVYNLDDIVPKSVLDTLSDVAKSITEDDDLFKSGLCPFSALNISQILSSTADELKTQRIVIFLYIDYLIKFMNTPVKLITKKFAACDKSPEVSNHILDNYSITSGHHRTRPLFMKDKAICSVLVLAALAMSYQVNIETLSKSIKLGIKKVQEISRILAFTSTAKNNSVVTLKLPLPAPVNFSTKRKRK